MYTPASSSDPPEVFFVYCSWRIIHFNCKQSDKVNAALSVPRAAASLLTATPLCRLLVTEQTEKAGESKAARVQWSSCCPLATALNARSRRTGAPTACPRDLTDTTVPPWYKNFDRRIIFAENMLREMQDVLTETARVPASVHIASYFPDC